MDWGSGAGRSGAENLAVGKGREPQAVTRESCTKATRQVRHLSRVHISITTPSSPSSRLPLLAASRSECITTEYNHLHASEFLALTTRRHGSVRPRDRIPPVCNTRECWSACRATMAHLSFPAHMHVAFNKRARSRQLTVPLINELRTLRLVMW